MANVLHHSNITDNTKMIPGNCWHDLHSKICKNNPTYEKEFNDNILKRLYPHCYDKIKNNIKCESCGVDLKDLYRCSRCKKTYYCSEQCQINNWSQHKLLCKKINILGSTD